jgi:hypothetical protein
MKNEEEKIIISNKEFLQALFGSEWEKVHVTAFTQDPSDIPNDERARCWAGGPAISKINRFVAESNQYFTISLFKLDSDGVSRRRKNLFDATFVIVADDVQEKLPLDLVNLLPVPSYKMYTSAGSQQWGWILDTPEEDMARVDNLLDGLVAKGVAPSGVDPGMRGTTRYVRLPEGHNTKAKRYVNGKPFDCYLSEWNPELHHSIEALAGVFDIDLETPRRESSSSALALSSPLRAQHPIWKKVDVTGVNGDWTLINCPNAENHTGADKTGAGILIANDGGVRFQCFHGNCEHLTGPKIVKMLELTETIDKYIVDMGVINRNILAETGRMKLAEVKKNGNEMSLYVNDPDGLNPNHPNMFRYIYLSTSNKFYDCVSGELLSNESIDNKYLRACPGGRGKDKASAYLHKNRDDEMSLADGIGWSPFTNQQPDRDAMVMSFGGKRLVNTWKGLRIDSIEGDCKLWLDLVKFLIPDEDQRKNIIQYLAFILQEPATKPGYCVIHRGGQGVGKDLMLVPLMRALGTESSGSVKIDDITNGWGDFLLQKKFMVIEEVDKGQSRAVNNALKTAIAPTATGHRTLNIKGKSVITQVDCCTFYMMSNKKQPLALEKDDRRYYVIDSFMPKKDAGYYKEIDRWIRNGGSGHVLHYLLNIDLSAYNPLELPAHTEAMLELQDSSKHDYEIVIEELVHSGVGLFSDRLFVFSNARKVVADAGVRCIASSLVEAIESNGFTQIRGAKKIEGKNMRSPRYFVKNEVAETLTTAREQYEYWLEWDQKGR